MRRHRVCLFGIVAAIVLAGMGGAAAFADESSAAVFAEGQTALKGGDFDGAQKLFARATRLDPKNETYRLEAALVRRVIGLRARLSKLDKQEEWGTAAIALHTYYLDHEIHNEALAIGRELHERMKRADTAALLAETLLRVGQNKEAVSLLEPWAQADENVQARALYGIALVREGQRDAAAAIAGKIKLAEDCDAHLAFDIARLRAGLSDTEGALEAIKHCLSHTPPSQLEDTRAAVSKCPDFAALAKTGAFAMALKTDSSVKESSCSGGTSCGACPSRSACAGEKSDAKTPPEKKP